MGPVYAEFVCKSCGSTSKYEIRRYPRSTAPEEERCRLCSGKAFLKRPHSKPAAPYNVDNLGMTGAERADTTTIKAAFERIMAGQFSTEETERWLVIPFLYSELTPWEAQYIAYHEANGWDAHPWL